MCSEVSKSSPTGVEPQLRTGEHLCPWWVGYLLASPLRRLVEKPEQILAPHVRPGMTVLDAGCAMGFFSIPLARMVGPKGRVVCVDIQERMIGVLRKRARRRGLENILEARTGTQGDLNVKDLKGKVDVVVAFHVIHETRHPARFLADCFDALRRGGTLFLAEPMRHLSKENRRQIFGLATATGFVKKNDLILRKSQAAVFEKPGGAPAPDAI